VPLAVTPAGPRGEKLSIDVASIGRLDDSGVVILSSGLHGIEGFFGSAVQLSWLQQAAVTGPRAGVRVVLAHALNPYGFAWLRRANEHNVDLNRNFFTNRSFLTSADYQAALGVYRRLSPFLNPASPPSRWEPYGLKAGVRAVVEGLKSLQRALPVGQHEFETGLFYGGSGEQETTSVLRSQLPVWIANARLAIHIDFHSGLGAWAEGQLMSVDTADSFRGRWIREQFGSAARLTDGHLTYRAYGTMAEDFRDRARPCVYHCLTAEFGTYSGIRVLGALRAENRAHFHAPRDSDAYHWAKRRMMSVFVPASVRWRTGVIDRALAMVNRAIDVCGS
jgi:hypothetical protein